MDRVAIEKIVECSLLLDSGTRLGGTLPLLAASPVSVFASAFVEIWPQCDSTWGHTTELLRLFRHHSLRYAVDSLPNVLTVYRGCSRPRIKGISWALSRDVAKKFADGHRGMRVPDPVVVTATVERNHVFARFAGGPRETEHCRH